MVTKYPLLRPAIAMAGGILLARWLPLIWQAGFALAAALALAASFSKSRRILFTSAFWLVLGGSLLSFRYEPRDPADLRLLLNGEPELVRVAGVLSDDPERRVLEQDGQTRYRTTARLSVREIQRRSVLWRPAASDLAISTTGFIPDDYVAGTRVEIFGVVSRPRGPIAPGLFDFEQYLKWQRVFFVLRADTTNDWRLTSQAQGLSAATLYRVFNNWARHTLQRGIPHDENTRLLWAMVLGWKPGLTNEISEPFMRTGTLHVFAKMFAFSPISFYAFSMSTKSEIAGMKSYSYIRWSSAPQSKGDSLKRQIERTRAVCAEYNLILDETLRPDKGISGYTGDNLSKGSLGKFIEKVKNGQIKTPCCLVVEGLARHRRRENH